MKKTFHLCISSSTKVMFRHNEDYIRGINCLCVAAYKAEASLLAYSFMSNHVHIGVRCEDPKKFMKIFRYSYTKYFNQKYKRIGRLGENSFFQLEIEGHYHLLAALAYILRNPLHHGVSATPFGYEYSSISSIFSKEFGRKPNLDILPKNKQYLYLPDRANLPSNYMMNIEGLILPESVIDVSDVEHQFSSARHFMFYMNRLSNDAWKEEQLQDKTASAPITLGEIEKGVYLHNIKTMLSNEYGRANYNAISDIELCYEIDKVILPKFNIDSVYELSKSTYDKVLNILYQSYNLPESQIARCLPDYTKVK